MSNKKNPASGSPAPRSGHGAASVIPHLEEDNARERPSGLDEPHAEGLPQDSSGQDNPQGSE